MLNLNILLELCLQTSVLFILLCFCFFYTYFGVYFQLIIIIIMYYPHCASTTVSDMQRMIWDELDLTGIAAEWEMSIKYAVSICYESRLKKNSVLQTPNRKQLSICTYTA